jgi:ATP-dependent helicase Lhr and Lhr-like helicase
LVSGGALFFGELVRRTGLLPSRVEQALAELTTQGLVTSDSFEGLRALIVPQEKRAPFVESEHRRRHKPVISVEYSGRWSLLRPSSIPDNPAQQSDALRAQERELAIQAFAWALLRRYGVVFRRLLEREALKVSWFELGRAYRRLEARGEIRGGFFVSGVSGEQFALPEAIALLRSNRHAPAPGQLLVISGADPLNLGGILTPGPRIPAVTAHRILLRDGLAIAALCADQLTVLEGDAGKADPVVERLLRIGSMSPLLRPYYS